MFHQAHFFSLSHKSGERKFSAGGGDRIVVVGGAKMMKKLSGMNIANASMLLPPKAKEE